MTRPNLILLLLACLTACTAQTAPLPAPITEAASALPSASPVPPSVEPPQPPAEPSPQSLIAPRLVPVPLPAGMVLEEYQLLGFPNSDNRDFTPLSGTQAEILAVRAAERKRPDPALAHLDPNDTRRLRASLDGKTIYAQIEGVAAQDANGTPIPQDILHVFLDEAEIYTLPLGGISPVSPLRGVWVYDGHWVVEVAQTDLASEMPLGQIIVDGELLNEKFGYDEAFEFQTMAGRPFHFFKRGGKIGALYDGQEIPLDYEIVYHYYCCSGSAFNPLAAQNMVSFFARRNGIWYYVELGVYE